MLSGHLSDEISLPGMRVGIQSPVAMEMEGAKDTSDNSIQTFLDRLGMHLYPVSFPILSSSSDSIVVSTSIIVGELTRGGHMGSHGGGEGA